ncbi:trypsin-like serine protease [Longispora urticae]
MIVSALLISTPAQAADPVPYGMSADTYAAMLAQRTDAPIADELQRAIDVSDTAGYTSLAYGPRGGLTLYWKGTLPQPVADAVTEARKRTKVHVSPAAWSRAEQKAAALAVHKHLASTATRAPEQILWSGEGTGLTIRSDNPGIRTLPLATLGGVPITLEAPERIELQRNRRYDNAPWWGGSYMSVHNVKGTYGCTTGFAVWRNGTRYMLTAGHCATAPDNVYNYIGGYMGWTPGPENWGHDVILVSLDGQSYGGRVYDGGTTSDWGKSVSGWDYARPGQWVCDSGAASGVHCSIQVGNQFAAQIYVTSASPDSDGDYNYWITDLIVATRTTGGVAAVRGDSGGPVFWLDGNRVRVIGTITGGSGDSGGSTLVFQDYYTAAVDLGLSGVVTSA